MQDPITEEHLVNLLNKKTPYTVEIYGLKFTITNNKTYPPGKLTRMFALYLVENNLIKNKVIADIGAACFPLGIIASKNGAKEVIGVDIIPEAIQCAKENMANNHVENNIQIILGDGADALLPNYTGMIDLIVSGVPWSRMDLAKFKEINEDQKALTRSFYDIDDQLIKSLASKGKLLLAPKGKILITSSSRVIERIRIICHEFNLTCKIVKEEDVHQDGEMHYILDVTPRLDT